MKICIVSAVIPPTHSGGGLSAFKYAHRLHRNGQLGLFLTRTQERPEKEFLKGYMCVCDDSFVNNIIRIPPKKYLIQSDKLIAKAVNYPIDIFKIFIKTFNILLKYRGNYDIIHCYSPTWISLMAVIIGKLLGKKLVLELTRVDGDDPGYVAKYDKYKILYQRRNIQYHMADAIICLSPILKERCINAGIKQNKLFLIPRPVDSNHYYPISNKAKIKKKLALNGYKPILLYVGGIIPRKNVHVLIEILYHLKSKYPDVKLLLVGPENESNRKYIAEIKKSVQENNLLEKILLTGYVNNVHEYMKISDIFILPSDSEGFPNVLVEAMASGLVVLTKNINGIMDYIINNGSNGFIVNDNDPGKYTNIINYVMSNHTIYNTISDNAVTTAKNRFSPKMIDRKYDEVYNNIICSDK